VWTCVIGLDLYDEWRTIRHSAWPKLKLTLLLLLSVESKLRFKCKKIDYYPWHGRFIHACLIHSRLIVQNCHVPCLNIKTGKQQKQRLYSRGKLSITLNGDAHDNSDGWNCLFISVRFLAKKGPLDILCIRHKLMYN